MVLYQNSPVTHGLKEMWNAVFTNGGRHHGEDTPRPLENNNEHFLSIFPGLLVVEFLFYRKLLKIVGANS